MNTITTQEARQYLEDLYFSSDEPLALEFRSAHLSMVKRQKLLAKFKKKAEQTQANTETTQLMPVYYQLMDAIQTFKIFISDCTGGSDEAFVLKSPIKYLRLDYLPQNLEKLEQQIRENIAEIKTIQPDFDDKVILKMFDDKMKGQINVLETMLPIILYNFLLNLEVDILESLLLYFFKS
ncbi:MAG TPA: hypothetical protein DCM08_01265 [Microscillaceae bacterium]|nr:hypothetical protein [Microscillaceae bacterium]